MVMSVTTGGPLDVPLEKIVGINISRKIEALIASHGTSNDSIDVIPTFPLLNCIVLFSTCLIILVISS